MHNIIKANTYMNYGHLVIGIFPSRSHLVTDDQKTTGRLVTGKICTLWITFSFSYCFSSAG